MTKPTLVIGNKNYSSWSMRPWVAMKAGGIDFEEIFIPLYTGPADKQRLLDVSPAGKVPALIDGDVTVWDSLAIIEYLAERFPVRFRASRLPGVLGIRVHRLRPGGEGVQEALQGRVLPFVGAVEEVGVEGVDEVDEVLAGGDALGAFVQFHGCNLGGRSAGAGPPRFGSGLPDAEPASGSDAKSPRFRTSATDPSRAPGPD